MQGGGRLPRSAGGGGSPGGHQPAEGAAFADSFYHVDDHPTDAYPTDIYPSTRNTLQLGYGAADPRMPLTARGQCL